jgi:lysophospholipase L1-like esterase
MSRARQAARVAAAAAMGGVGLGALSIAGYGVLLAEVQLARRAIGDPFTQRAPVSDGVYGDGPGPHLELAALGDSSAVGLGVEDPAETPGAQVAIGLSQLLGRPVRLTVAAVVGAESTDLGTQVDRLLAGPTVPDAAVIMVGANDVTHRAKPSVAVASLGDAVARLRAAGCHVVVGTCPDLGTIEPVPQPLRTLGRRWSRQLAAAQTIAVVEAGGRSVSLGDLLGPEFAADRRMFSADRFHPSATGYARAAEALLPSVAAALGHPCGDQPATDGASVHEVHEVAAAAVHAADHPGTEVTGTEAGTAQHGRWALLSRLRRIPLIGVGAGAVTHE